jgi:hypothetical protein
MVLQDTVEGSQKVDIWIIQWKKMAMLKYLEINFIMQPSAAPVE